MSKQERRAAPSTWLLILAFAIATIVFVALTSTTSRRGVRDVQELFAQERILQATAVRNSINESAQRLIDESRILAEHSFFQYERGIRDRASMEDLFDIELEHYGEVAAYRYEPYTGGQPVYRAVESESGTIARELAIHWGRIYAVQLASWDNTPIVTPVSMNGALSFVGFVHPVWTSGTLAGALIAVVDLDALLAQYVGRMAAVSHGTVFIVDESLAVVWPSSRSAGSRSLRKRFHEAADGSLAALEQKLAAQETGVHFLDVEAGPQSAQSPILSWAAFALGDRRFAVVIASEEESLSSLLMSQQRQRTLLYAGTLAAVLLAAFGLLRYQFVNAEKRMLHEHREELVREVAARTEDVERLLARYEGLFEGANDAILLVEHGRIVNCNRRAAELFGADRTSIIGRPADFLCAPASKDSCSAGECEYDSPTECTCRTVGGSEFDAELTLNTITEGDTGTTQAIVRDVTNRNRSIREKNQMLQELDHRVNNNLQIMSSLLSLESRNSDSSEAADALRRAHRRIYTMSVLHSRLQGQSDRAGVPADQYLTDILSFFEQKAFAAGIDLRSELDDSILNPDLCLGLGLVTGELIERSVERTFAIDTRRRIVEVTFRTDGGSGVLRIADNGLGQAEEGKGGRVSTQIVRSLAAQLRGEIEWEPERGSTVSLRFPIGG